MEISVGQPAEITQAPPVTMEQPTPQPAPVEGVPSPSPAGVARLLLKRAGILTGDEFPVGKKVVIGRFHEETGPVDIDLSNLHESVYVSRRHAEIYQDASGQWFVKDLGSTCGTYLCPSNTGQFQKLPAHQPVPIKDGDEVAFGNARFLFRTQG